MSKRFSFVVFFVAIIFVVWIATASANIYDVQKELALYGNLNQNSMQIYWDPIQHMNVGCGPTAAVNSFVYLQKKYGSVYDTLLVPACGQDLDGNGIQDFYDDEMAVGIALGGASYMNTLANLTTFHDDFIWGKKAYIESVASGNTVYAAQDWWAWTNTERPKPAWVAPVKPTWGFIYNELKACEDVEILLSWSDGGHFLTLTSLHWNDADNDGIIDFGENASMDYIDPCTGAWGQSQIWTGGSESDKDIETDYNTSSTTWISMAVAESPVPEPSTLIMLLLAGMCGLTLRRRA